MAIGITCVFLLAAGSRIEAPRTSSELRWSAPFGEGEVSVARLMEMGVLTAEYRPEPDGVWVGDGESFWSLAPVSGAHDSLVLTFITPDWRSADAQLAVRLAPAWLASPTTNDPVLATVQFAPGSSGVIAIDLSALPVGDGRLFMAMVCSPAERPLDSADTRALCAKLVHVQRVTEAKR
jgi:hypothetical protein